MLTAQTPICDIVQVTLWFRTEAGKMPDTQTHLMHKDYVDEFKKASIKLHYSPGVNPHNGNKTAKIDRIEVRALEPQKPYWWARESLGVGDSDEEQPMTMVNARWLGYKNDWHSQRYEDERKQQEDYEFEIESRG